MKSKDIKIYNLPADDVCQNFIDSKPGYLLLVIAFVGLILIIPFGLYLYGGCLLIFGLLAYFLTPSNRMIEFYQDYLVLHNKASHSDCMMIYYDEINKWNYKFGISYDELVIELTDGRIVELDAFSRVKFEYCMNQYVKEKKAKKAKKSK